MLILLDPAHGHNTQLLVPETEDIPLKERVRRANAICTALGHTHCPAVLIENFFMDTNRISPTSSHKKADEK